MSQQSHLRPNRIKQERLRRGWTVTRTAFESTLTRTEVSQIENGRLIPTDTQLGLLAVAFDVKPPYSVLLEPVDIPEVTA